MIRDPLRESGMPDSERLLFQSFQAMAAGKPVDAVLGAALNLIVNAIRQSTPFRKRAEEKYDHVTRIAKTMLLDQHYDSVTGMRRSVFPFTQVIRPQLHEDRDSAGVKQIK